MIRRASVADTARVLGGVFAPIVAQGVIARRRRAVTLATRLDLDARSVAILRRMRRRYGPGPLLLRLPLPGWPPRRMAVLLDPDDLERVLRESPEPFSADNREKHAALGQFQPHGVLISRGALRDERRRFVEGILDTGHPVHRLAEPIHAVATEEAQKLLADVEELTWDAWMAAWWQVVRRVVLGDAARDDSAVTDLLTRLRGRANWSSALPHSRGSRLALRDRLAAYVDRAEPGSLAALIARAGAPDVVDALDQIPQWLFAFDPAGMAAYRALGLLAAHPAEQERARPAELDGPAELPLLRAAVLESVRLWPTTAVVLRDTTAQTAWPGGTLPRGTAVAIVSAYFHRDPGTVPGADTFVPDQWVTGDPGPAVIPFSAGPVVCPGRELVLFTTSTFLATVLQRRVVPGPGFPLSAGRPLPAALDAFTLRLRLEG